MARGGKRPGAGRKRGGRNKRTAERIAAMNDAARAATEVLGDKAFSGDAHALLMLTYKNEALPLQTRLEAAKAAIAYERPKLQAIEHSGEIHRPRPLSDLSDDELLAIAASIETGSPPVH